MKTTEIALVLAHFTRKKTFLFSNIAQDQCATLTFQNMNVEDRKEGNLKIEFKEAWSKTSIRVGGGLKLLSIKNDWSVVRS